jgi:lipopolysaccharide transport system ATP-binding protein
MSTPIITVENLGKKYRLTHQGERPRYRALRDVIAEMAKRPFHRLRRTNREAAAPASEEFWALQGVDFEVQEGEVVGIIGRNGAGKSTVLKILSRITEPTTGRVRIRGRLASLLEVGTGFHPELTGRENIYLNGAIMGMARSEIRHKFDEIVAFAEVEKFLDTPVKRYSSGMYVRLAFAVAAHLEPEILVVDEVLAVGDAEFQKKCLGKMRDVSKGGRTVLFVSHNMAAVKSLTTRGIVLSRGRVVFNGTTDEAIHAYIQSPAEARAPGVQRSWGRGMHTAIRALRLVGADGESTLQYLPGQPLRIEIELETDGTGGMSIELFLRDMSRMPLGLASSYQFHGETLPSSKGAYICRVELEPMWLASGSYTLDARTSVPNVCWDHSVEDALEFDVPFSNPLGRELDFKQTYGFGPLALLACASFRFDPLPKTSDVALYENAGEQVR